MAPSPAVPDIAKLLPEDLPLCPASHGMRQLAAYVDMLVFWNRSFNLVGARSREKIVRDLICDSFHLAFFLNRLLPGFAGTVWEPGAGAGLPGIPLRILWQNGEYTMIEAREKRALFLDNVLSRLGLPGTAAVQARIESFIKGRKAECVLSRAFMPWPKLLKLFTPARADCLVIMANQPAPQLPCKLLEQYEYAIQGKKRWFWALAAQ